MTEAASSSHKDGSPMRDRLALRLGLDRVVTHEAASRGVELSHLHGVEQFAVVNARRGRSAMRGRRYRRSSLAQGWRRMVPTGEAGGSARFAMISGETA